MDDDYIGVYSSYFLFEDSSNSIKFIEILNARIKHAVPIYTANILKKIVEEKCPNTKVNFVLHPIPFTVDQENQVDQMRISLIVFFVAIAFSLIPANFITKRKIK